MTAGCYRHRFSFRHRFAHACTSYRLHTRPRASSASGAGKPGSSAIRWARCLLTPRSSAISTSRSPSDVKGSSLSGECGVRHPRTNRQLARKGLEVENYFLSPRISAKTIELNPGVAFGAAIAGGAVGGFAGAFFALPVAATVQTFISEYSTSYAVEESALTQVDRPPPDPPKRARGRFRRRSESGASASIQQDADRNDAG